MGCSRVSWLKQGEKLNEQFSDHICVLARKNSASSLNHVLHVLQDPIRQQRRRQYDPLSRCHSDDVVCVKPWQVHQWEPDQGLKESQTLLAWSQKDTCQSNQSSNTLVTLDEQKAHFPEAYPATSYQSRPATGLAKSNWGEQYYSQFLTCWNATF